MTRFVLLILLLQAQALHAGLYWQPDTQGVHAYHGHGRALKNFSLSNISEQFPLDTQLIHSDLNHSNLEMETGSFTLKPTGKNSYHALFALQTGPELERSAIRYIYLNGRPVDNSPQDILELKKSSIEITPAPLPREHWKYESRKTYRFIISIDNQPIADHPVLATTAFGSSQILHTDKGGLVEITIPEDFPEITPARRATPQGELRLFTSLEQDGKRYETSLSAPYQASPANWKSASLGFLFIGLGAISGLFLIGKVPAHQRRKKA